jgi:ABC-type transport system involved in multi-copper enzyme maturation permease subunit
VKILVILGVSLLYLSVFVVLGLLVSTILKETQASLVVALLAWVVLVIVIPAGAALSAKLLVDVPDYDRIAEEAGRAEQEAIAEHNRRYPHPDNWAISGNWSPGEPLLRAFRVAEAGSAVRQRHEDRQISQVWLGQELARFSPAGLYNSAAVYLAGSGIAHYQSFVRQARRYRQELGRFVESQYPFNVAYPEDGAKVQDFTRKQRIDFQSVPVFDERLMTISEGWTAATWDVGLLALLNVVLFAATWMLFLRYDVR